MSEAKKASSEATVKVKLHENNSATAEEAPYLVTVVPNGTIDRDGIIDEMQKQMPHVSKPTIAMVLDAMIEVVVKELRSGHKVETPFGTFEPHITGSSEYLDSPFDPKRNKLVVKVTPPRGLREAAAKLKAEIVNAPTSELALNGVETSALGRDGVDVIKSGEAFTLTGRGFLDGTLSAAVVDSAGTTHQLSLTTVKSLYAQSQAPASIAHGEARVVLTLTDAEDHSFTASRKVVVV